MEISYIETETKSEFIRMLKKKNFNKLILGEEQEGSNKYYIFQLMNNNEITFVLGVICMNNGLKPEAVWVNNKLF